MGKKETIEKYNVAWFDGKKINEAIFCEEFIRDFPMLCINGTFFTVDGMVSDESGMRREIYKRIKPYLTTGLSKKVANLVDVLGLECASQSLPIYLDRIHVRNGTYYLNGCFSAQKEFCRNRLPVAYNPAAPKPETWLRFLSELLKDEDIPTLQEFMGYCLIPSTKGQKAIVDGNNIIEFLSSEGYIRFDTDRVASSKDLYAAYKLWCEDNAFAPLAQKSFCAYLKQHENKYHIRYTNKVNIGRGKYIRGFTGIEITQRLFL